MKKICFFLVLFGLLCCKKDNQYKSSIEGYYYDSNKFEFYQLKADSIFIYNFNDSILTKLKASYNKRYIDIGEQNEHKYNYVKFNKDSLLIKDFKGTGYDLKLKKFHYKNIDKNELNGFYWYLVNRDSVNIEVRDTEIVTFLTDENGLRPVGYNMHLGSFFNKFNLYSGAESVRSIVNISNDTLTLISGSHNFCEKILFVRASRFSR